MSHLTFDTTINREHRIVSSDDAFRIQDNVHMAADYTVVSPDVIADRLSQAGFNVTGVHGFGGGWQEALVVSKPGAPGPIPGYTGEVSILLNNAGRSSILLRTGVVRYACANSFAADDCVTRIRHDSDEADEFLANPARFVREALAGSHVVAERIEALRGSGVASDLISAVGAKQPRVAKALAKATSQYLDVWSGISLGRLTFWSALQGLTDASVSFRQGRFELAQQLLTAENVALLVAGQVPELN